MMLFLVALRIAISGLAWLGGRLKLFAPKKKTVTDKYFQARCALCSSLSILINHSNKLGSYFTNPQPLSSS